MTSTLQEESDSNAPLDLLEMETLPPLSPRMQRAFLEVFGDEEVSEESRGEETVTLRQDAAWLSPSQEAMTAEWVTTMSPSKTNGVSEEDSVEARRARRSAIEKKSRQRRQGVLGRMRQELKHLESVYAEMAKKQDAAVSNGALSRPHKGSLQHRYTQLSLVTQALKEDRIKLLKLLESHEVFQRTAEAMARRGDGRRRGQEQEGDLIWDTGVPPSSSFTVQIPRRSPAECYELVRETYETIKRFDDGGHFVSTGANFMGWTDKRKLDEARSLQYGFSKTFPLESAEGLLMRTWDVFCHADTMAHLSFNASVATRFEIVQLLGDDLCIIRRDHKFPSMAMNFVTVHIVFRLQTPTGYTLCMRTIPAPEVKSALEPHEFYYDVFHWTHFNQLFDESGQPAGCEISTGGYIADVKQLVSKYWLFELVMSVLRWENMCVAPLFLKL